MNLQTQDIQLALTTEGVPTAGRGTGKLLPLQVRKTGIEDRFLPFGGGTRGKSTTPSKLALFLSLTILTLAFLTTSTLTVQAIEAIYAPSIFENTPLESRCRTVVENLLFLQVLEDQLQRGTLEDKEIKLIQEKQRFSAKIIQANYDYLFTYYHANADQRKQLTQLVLEKQNRSVQNEVILLNYLLAEIRGQATTLNLKKAPELDQKAESYRFYQEFLNELTRLARLFPEIPSEIAAFDQEREVLGFRFADRQVVLTFDDGPSALTPKILATLKETQTDAAFFVQGSKLMKSGVVDETALNYIFEALQLGANVGVHSVTHPNLIKITDESKLTYELQKTKELLEQELGYQPKFFRAPYGSRNPANLHYILAEYQYHILWNIDSQDWRKEFTREIMLARVVRLVHLYNGGIVLFHDTNRKSVEILPEVIRELKDCGFEFSDLSSLLL